MVKRKASWRRLFIGEIDMKVVKIVRDRLLGKHAGVSDPENKRKITGHEFVSNV